MVGFCGGGAPVAAERFSVLAAGGLALMLAFSPVSGAQAQLSAIDEANLNAQVQDADVSDAAVISDLETIQGELDDFLHSDSAMAFACKRLQKAKQRLTGNDLEGCPEPAIDADIATLLNDITAEIELNDHAARLILLVRRELDKVYVALNKNRTGVQEPPELDPAFLLISGTDPVDLGTANTGVLVSQTVTVTNTGDQDATAVLVGGIDNTAEWSFSTTCGSTLLAGANCSVTVSYLHGAPIPIGILQDTLEISYFNGTANDLATRLFQVDHQP